MNRTETSWAKVSDVFGKSFLLQDSVGECIYQNDDILLFQYAFFADDNPVYILRTCTWMDFDYDEGSPVIEDEWECVMYCEDTNVATACKS